MSSQKPLEALKFIENYASIWQSNFKETHTNYIHSGCFCCHKEELRNCQAQLEGIIASYDELLTYCSESQSDINQAAVALHQAKKHVSDVSHNHNQEEKSMLKQMRAISLQTQARDNFVRHTVKASKRRDISALARITAGYGAQCRFELEKRASKQFTNKFFDTEEELSDAESQLRHAEKIWQNARNHATLISKIQSLSCTGKGVLENFLLDEEKRGVHLWAVLREQETSRVAAEGLKILICQACDGWRWEPKAPLKV